MPIALSQNSSTVKRKNPPQSDLARFSPAPESTTEFSQLSGAIGKITGTIELLSTALNFSVISRSPTVT